MVHVRQVEPRRWDRVPVEMQVELFVGADILGREAQALDLSWNGARIRADGAMLKPADPVDVVLVGANIWQRRTARVIWVERVDSQPIFQAGLSFLRPLASEA